MRHASVLIIVAKWLLEFLCKTLYLHIIVYVKKASTISLNCVEPSYVFIFGKGHFW